MNFKWTEEWQDLYYNWHMSRLMTKPPKWYVRPAKTQISLGIRPVWSESSLCAQWVAKDPSFLHADSEDSGWSDWADAQADLSLRWAYTHFVGFIMRRLICVQRSLRTAYAVVQSGQSLRWTIGPRVLLGMHDNDSVFMQKFGRFGMNDFISILKHLWLS